MARKRQIRKMRDGRKRKKLKEYDELSRMVLRYRKNRRKYNKLFEEIQEKVWGLPIKVMNSYGIKNFPDDIVDDILQECRTLILLKAIRLYDKYSIVWNKGRRKKINRKGAATFTCFYYWKLLSHVRYRLRVLLLKSGTIPEDIKGRYKKLGLKIKNESDLNNILNTCSFQNNLEENSEFENVISTRKSFKRLSLRDSDVMDDMRGILTDRQYMILEYVIFGYTFSQISKKMKLNIPNLRIDRKKIEKKVIKYLKSSI